MIVKQIIDIKDLDKIVNWMYNWWGIDENYDIKEVESMMKYSLNKDNFPKTYGLYLDEELIGMCQIVLNDLEIRPDLYPWLANVYIDPKYRNNGYVKILLNYVLKQYKELYLYTEITGLYEKLGFEFIDIIDTITKKVRYQRLYKLNNML